jgi:hypothetical protein
MPQIPRASAKEVNPQHEGFFYSNGEHTFLMLHPLPLTYWLNKDSTIVVV